MPPRGVYKTYKQERDKKARPAQEARSDQKRKGKTRERTTATSYS